MTLRAPLPLTGLALATLIALTACSDSVEFEGPSFAPPETAVAYDVAIEGMPSDALESLARDSLAATRLEDEGAASLAFLRRRAEQDVALMQKILASRGYFRGTVEVDVDKLAGEAGDSAGAGTEEGEEQAPRGQALVTFRVDPGPAFTLVRHDIALDDPSGTAPALEAAALGSPVGGPAEAAAIVEAEQAALAHLKRHGFPYARAGARDAVADMEAATLEVTSAIATGPAATFGAVHFRGLEDVSEEYLRTYIPWEPQSIFDVAQIRTFQQSMLGTDLFETITAKPPEEAPEGAGPMPVDILVEASERPFRTIAAGARYSRDKGPSVTGSYQNRNLYGANETFTTEAEVGIELQSIGVGFLKPQYLRPGQDLTASLRTKREDDDAFEDITTTATLGLQRRLTSRWTVGAGGLAEVSFIQDEGEDTTSYIFGLPMFASYDSSDNALDPTEGIRFRAEFTPLGGIFDDEFVTFPTLDATGSTYFDITGEKSYIFAVRGRLGSILTDDVDSVPPPRRLYSGGGGSVRGFAQRFVGPLDASNDPIGGLSVVEFGAEFRGRIWGDLGGVVFAEAGSVSDAQFPDFNEGVQIGVGAGIRYYSPAGPIRVDLAFPIDPRPADDSFQIFFSIGQAF